MKRAEALGLHHMAGNAAEWVEDWFGIDYYATMPDRNPRGAGMADTRSCGRLVEERPAVAANGHEKRRLPDQRAATIGFRCARSAR